MINRDTLRISASLTGLAIFVVFIAQWTGIVPDENSLRAQNRAIMAEALAIQFSITVQQKNIVSIPLTIKAIVERNPDIQAIRFRTYEGDVIGSYGDQAEQVEKKSTANYMVVPIFQDNQQWAELEISFNTMAAKPWWKVIDSTFYQLVVFIAIILLLFHYILIRRIFTYLDPNKVVPERVKKALNALIEGVVIIDSDGVIALANRSFEQKLGVNGHQLVGSKLSTLLWTYPEKNADTSQQLPWDSALATGSNCNHITLNYSLSEKSTLTLITNCTPLYDSSNSLRGVLVSFSDVSELEKINQDLESMAQFLRHEMNNALIGASSTISLIETSAHLSDTDKRLLSRAHQSHRVIRYLLDSVGQATTIEASFSKETTYPLRIDTIIAETVARYSSIYSANEFSYRSDGEPAIVLAVEERIIQMLDKLATNAIDHGNTGTPVIFSCIKNDGKVVISVQNEGVVLPENKQGLFDLFASFGDSAANKQNQGIGLYVVKIIAETYGGKVYARDRTEVSGAEFIIELPLAE